MRGTYKESYKIFDRKPCGSGNPSVVGRIILKIIFKKM
jgi:hypothetical protein